ncbi:protein Pbn1p [[Candida] anglica]|uniref:Protein PBN1 n=1 Tax=[Candida] anglica TaxID=148631 RepID=A0ABP0EQ26_9ASCO
MAQSKHRITYFNPTSSNDNVIKSVSENFLELPVLEGYPREDKISIPSNTVLPRSIKLLRFQWSDGSSNVSPIFREPSTQQLGFHIHAAPQKDAHIENFWPDLCLLLTKILGERISPDQFVITTNSVYISRPATEIPAKLIENVKTHWLQNDKAADVSSLNTLSALGSNIDIIMKPDGVVFSSVIPDSSSINELQETESTVFKSINEESSTKQEIGIFLLDEGISSEDDLTLSGVRFIIDPLDSTSDDKLHKTLFHVKPRHRHFTSASYSVALEDPVGLHPTLQIRFNDTLQSPQLGDGLDIEECKLFYYQSLQKSFFVDKYQLPKNVSLITLFGNSDLEAPAYKINSWGVEALLELESESDLDFTLHSRYQLPAKAGENDTITQTINTPSIFYACTVPKDSEALSASPFDYTSALAYNTGSFQSYFTDDTVFYHIDHSPKTLDINIPRGTGNPSEINYWTWLILGVGISWLLYKSVSLLWKPSPKPISPTKKTE